MIIIDFDFYFFALDWSVVRSIKNSEVSGSKPGKQPANM